MSHIGLPMEFNQNDRTFATSSTHERADWVKVERKLVRHAVLLSFVLKGYRGKRILKNEDAAEIDSEDQLLVEIRYLLHKGGLDAFQQQLVSEEMGIVRVQRGKMSIRRFQCGAPVGSSGYSDGRTDYCRQ